MPDVPLVVLGYHGTSKAVGKIILNPKTRASDMFLHSTNETDWLGYGIYFFQDAPYHANEWQMVRPPPAPPTRDPIVLCAELELHNCLDLLDTKEAPLIAERYVKFKATYREAKRKLPKNRGPRRRLDCVLLNYVVDSLEREGRQIDCVRAAFREGKPVVPGSQLFTHDHVQVVVRPYRTYIIRDVWEHPFPKGE